MRAVTISEPGGPEVLSWSEVPDLLQRRGPYPPPPGASEVLGLECSGVVSEVGEGVTGWSVGDEVCALLSGGGYAERVAVPAGQLLPRPAGVELATAAVLPEVVCTVWSNVFMLAGLRRGDTFLVHGGRPGVHRGGHPGQARRLPRAGCGGGCQLPRRGLRRAGAGGDRRGRRGRR